MHSTYYKREVMKRKREKEKNLYFEGERKNMNSPFLESEIKTGACLLLLR
jgi:hypothetical protein